MFYPGKRYGIDGPVASIRLHAIRDGNEEYEVLYDLRNTYENAEYSADDIIKFISDDLYEGTRYIGDPAKYAEARSQLLCIAALLKNGGVMITDIEESEADIKFTVAADKGVLLKANGEDITPKFSEGEKAIYIIEVPLNSEQNYFELQSGAVSFRVYLGGKAVKYNAEDMLQDYSSSNDGASFTIENGNVVAALPKVDSDTTHLVSLVGDVVSAIGENSSKLTISINSPVEIAYEI